jgi:hypothetical protein
LCDQYWYCGLAVEALAARYGLALHVRHPLEEWGGAGMQAAAREWRRKESEALLTQINAQVSK